MAAYGDHNDVISVSLPRSRLTPAVDADHCPAGLDRCSPDGLDLDPPVRELVARLHAWYLGEGRQDRLRTA